MLVIWVTIRRLTSVIKVAWGGSSTLCPRPIFYWRQNNEVIMLWGNGIKIGKNGKYSQLSQIIRLCVGKTEGVQINYLT